MIFYVDWIIIGYCFVTYTSLSPEICSLLLTPAFRRDRSCYSPSLLCPWSIPRSLGLVPSFRCLLICLNWGTRVVFIPQTNTQTSKVVKNHSSILNVTREETINIRLYNYVLDRTGSRRRDVYDREFVKGCRLLVNMFLTKNKVNGGRVDKYSVWQRTMTTTSTYNL